MEYMDVLCFEVLNRILRQFKAEAAAVHRAALLDGLQKKGMRHRPLRQGWAQSILLATQGLDLTQLKALLDDGADHHSFYKLVHYDLQVPPVHESSSADCPIHTPAV